MEAVNLKVPVTQWSGIDQMEISQQNQDLRQGDTSARLSASLYEYLLGHLSIAGRTSSPSRFAASGNGQFRTPRHIIPLWDIIRTPSAFGTSPKFDR